MPGRDWRPGIRKENTVGALYDMKAFFAWLENASERELVQRRDLLAHALQHKLTDPNVIADARYLLRQIEQELLARAMK